MVKETSKQIRQLFELNEEVSMNENSLLLCELDRRRTDIYHFSWLSWCIIMLSFSHHRIIPALFPSLRRRLVDSCFDCSAAMSCCNNT